MALLRRSRNNTLPKRVKNFEDLAKFPFAEYAAPKILQNSSNPEICYGMSSRDLTTDHQVRLSELNAFKRALLDSYSERNFLINVYLPRVRGDVLDVGVNKPNQRDFEALPLASLHHTIDTDPSVSEYGSPTDHRTLNFFDLPVGEKYMHLLMFGLIGTPNNRSVDDAHITEDKNDEMIIHADQFVIPGGEILLGPELSGVSSKEADSDVRNWISWIQENNTLSSGYELSYALRGRCNLIAIMHKHN